ncbi:MAG: hypothetical protein DRI95_02140 [Bacteroidetes bacterium]|nr:MAG: hypothetical protein DRI95_02140 [Bacteroidota bacterium]
MPIKINIHAKSKFNKLLIYYSNFVQTIIIGFYEQFIKFDNLLLMSKKLDPGRKFLIFFTF